MNSKSNAQAMETEKIPRLLAQLAIPAVVAQIINLLYNIVDRIYIGHIPGVGAAALTGVGLFTPILMLINAFAMLAGSGGAPRAAISMGKKDNKTAEKILGNCFAILMLMAACCTRLFMKRGWTMDCVCCRLSCLQFLIATIPIMKAITSRCSIPFSACWVCMWMWKCAPRAGVWMW